MTGKTVASTNVETDDELGSVRMINETVFGATIPNHLTSDDASEIKSNLIDSVIVSRLEKQPFSISQKKVQREQLELISIEENVNFSLGHNVRAWITMETSTSAKNGLVGIGDSSLVLIADRKGTYEIVEELNMKTAILCFTNFLHWNHTSKSVHGVVIVEIASQLIFVAVRDDLSGLQIIWQWTIHSRLDSLFYYKHESSDVMLMINAPSAEDTRISADIYRFDLHSRHTWLIQKIPLNEPCKSVAVINTYRELIMCFAQNNTVELFKCDPHANSKAFKYLSTIEASHVQTVSGFQMGGHSYLATTGLEPKIFLYHRGSFVAQTILSRRWGLVEVIFPIPARTYRDDLILLVQHRIMMGTHTVTVVEALIWDGQSFDVSLSVPCRIGDEVIDFGMTCLLDYERDTGIDGLSIIQNGNSISLIVPRVEAPSSMFRLQFELSSFDSPSSTVAKDFEIFSKNIEATTNYQNDVMSQGDDALTHGLSTKRNDVNAIWNLTAVTADSLIVRDGARWKIDEIFFGNELWTEDNLSLKVADLMTILQELQSKVIELEKESLESNGVELGPDSQIHNIATPPLNGQFAIKTAPLLQAKRLPRRTGKPDGRMKVNQLNVKNIKVDYINGVPVEDIIFTQNGVLNSVSSLIVDGSMKVLNEVEVTSEHMETVGDGIEDKQLSEKSIPADNIHITGDLNIDSINGVSWEDFVLQIVMRNLPNLIDELTVNGAVIAKESIQVDFLNQISFPGDFLWMHDSDITIITGAKVFKGILTAESVDTSGTVDGIYTQETISLGEMQHISGLTTFTQLEATESLDVNGTINGKHLDDFKPNLSLVESNIITSDCLFQNLQVDGPIFIIKDCNGFILDDILSDVVYKSSPKSTIASFKTFDSIQSTVELTSNLINNIPVDDYMTTDTAQDITFDQLVGNVLIRQLYTSGLFEFINVTELDQNSIKLSGEQFTEAELIFEGGRDEIDIDVNTVEIQRSFNGLSASDLIRIDEALEINGNVVVNSALINDLVISGEVNGNGVVNGVSLSEFDAIRFSRTRVQDIVSMYVIENVAIDNEIDSTYVNGLHIADLVAHINHITNLPEFLSSADVKVNNLIIDGNVSVRTINGHDFNSIKDNAVWLNQPNIVAGELQFLDSFEIGQGIIVSNVNGEIFEDFVNGLVLKTDENVEFTGRKIFQNEFHVDQDIQADTINGMSTRNIWTKSSPTHLTGQFNLIGNLFVENVNLKAYVNAIYWSQIEDQYHYDVERRAHVLTDNVQFTTPTSISHLQIQHGLNSVENITDFLSTIIRKNYAGSISGRKQFQGNVIFLDNLQADNMESVNILTLFYDVVINDENQKIVVFGDIAFGDDVAAAHIHVAGDILTITVMDCSLSEWNENGLRTDSPVKIFQYLLFPAATLRTTNVELLFLNGNSMATIFTLNSDQFFGQSLLSDLTSSSNINVDGLVNGLNMKAFMDNSVLVTGDNYISAPTTLQSARVLSVLETVGTVNGKNLNNIATLHDEDLHLYGPLSFRSITARNLNTIDTISGINFDYWYANALWKSQRENQIVSGVWTVSEAIFHSSVEGVAILNGIQIESLAGRIAAYQSNVQNNFDVFNQGYVENCNKMQMLIHKTQKLPYFLTHFEEAFSLRVQNVLNSVHFFAANGQNYVLLNLGCLTVLYVWNRIIGSYEKIIEAETGNVDFWLDMMDETNSIHLISNTEAERSNCPTSGLNVWKVDGSSLVHLSKIADSNKFSLLHSSNLHPQQFFAMAKNDGVVNAFDLKNNLVEQWHLPANDQNFRFVPENANLGVALSNGKQLSSLSYAKSIVSTDNRKERSTDPIAKNELKELKRFVRCPFLDKALENATANCKLWNQAKLKALSNIRPFKDLDLTTQDRLLNDAKMSNIQLGSSPFRLTVIPSEKPPFHSKFMQILRKNGLPSIEPLTESPMSSTADNQPENDSGPVNATARDAFGDMEKIVVDMADNVIDAFIDLDATNQDVDFDDSFIGSSSKNGSSVGSKPMLDSTTGTTNVHTNNNQTSFSRDMFGEIEAKTTKLADKVMDVFEDIKDKAKESHAKLHNMFQVHPANSDPYTKMEPTSDEQKMENKNLPKIPKVIYTTNGTVLHSTQQSSLMHETNGPAMAADASTVPSEDTTTSTTSSSSTEEHIETEKDPSEDVGEEEPKIAKEFFSEGIGTAENLNFPNHPAEEIVGITVGENRKHLVAVSSLREHTIQGKHDLIRIYEDIIEGALFQTLVCHRPRSLTVLNIRDESILAFIENDADIQICVYRGIQGFVQFTSFELSSFVYKLTSIHLPVGNPFACPVSYLAATMKKEVRFIEAKTCGYCGVNAQLTCD